MALNTTRIVGTVDLPTGETPLFGRVVFQLVRWDKNGANLFVPGPVAAPIATDGSIDIQLESTDAMEGGALYGVKVAYFSLEKKKIVEVRLSNIAVPTSTGSVALSTLLQFEAPLPDVPDALEQINEALARALAAAARAETAAELAGDNALVDYIRATVAELPNASGGAIANQNAFVTGTGNFYHFNGTTWINDGPGPLSQYLTKTVFDNVVRQNFYARTVNVTYDAATNTYAASIPENFPANFTEIGGEIEVTFPSSNTVAGARLVVAGFNRELANSANVNIPLGYITAGSRYRIRKFSNGRWNIVSVDIKQGQIMDLQTRATSLETRTLAIQNDIALLDTVRSPIPMIATQEAYGGTVVLTPVSEMWPIGSIGYEYSFTMPLGKPAMAGISFVQGGRTRTISNTKSQLLPGARITYKITSNNSGNIVNPGLSDDQLYALQTVTAGAWVEAVQKDSTPPARPTTGNRVIFYAWTDPRANMKPGDIWAQVQTPAVPDAPSVKNFYVRPTLGSLASDIVIRGLDPKYPIPNISGYQYVINSQSPVVVAAQSPSANPINYPFVADQEVFVQLAATNLSGTGAYSPIKYYTPRVSDVFSHPLVTRGSLATEDMQGAVGFNNLQRSSDHFILTPTGAQADNPNSTAYAQTDVNGLSGTQIYGAVKVGQAGTVTADGAAVILGLNNPWNVDANTIDTGAFPDGLFWSVTVGTWRLVRRMGNNSVTLASGTNPAPTSIRFERYNNIVRGYVNATLMVTQDISAVDQSYFDANKGVIMGSYRVGGGASPYFKLYDFTAGLLA